MMPSIRRRKLAQFVDVYCDYGAFTVPQSRRYLEQARALGFGLKIHAEQFACTGAARMAVELGAASVDHLEQAGEEDIRALAQSNTIATLLPGSVFHLGLRKYAPGTSIDRSGRGGGPGNGFQSRHEPDVQYADGDVAGLCGDAHVARGGDLGGNHQRRACFGRAGQVGSLEPGKRADLAILNVSDYRELPYYFGGNNVQATIKRGAILSCPKPS